MLVGGRLAAIPADLQQHLGSGSLGNLNSPNIHYSTTEARPTQTGFAR